VTSWYLAVCFLAKLFVNASFLVGSSPEKYRTLSNNVLGMCITVVLCSLVNLVRIAFQSAKLRFSAAKVCSLLHTCPNGPNLVLTSSLVRLHQFTVSLLVEHIFSPIQIGKESLAKFSQLLHSHMPSQLPIKITS
jgi:hypothetical protein